MLSSVTRKCALQQYTTGSYSKSQKYHLDPYQILSEMKTFWQCIADPPLGLVFEVSCFQVWALPREGQTVLGRMWLIEAAWPVLTHSLQGLQRVASGVSPLRPKDRIWKEENFGIIPFLDEMDASLNTTSLHTHWIVQLSTH